MSRKGLGAVVGGALWLTLGSSALAETAARYPVAGPFFTTYLACNGSATSLDCGTAAQDYESAGPCCTTKTVLFFLPDGAGDFPLFFFTVGTNGTVLGTPSVDLILKGIAEKGVIAAAPAYQNQVVEGLTCAPVSAKAANIFDQSIPTSAISRLIEAVPEALPGVRPSPANGVVTGGFSQGSWLAVLAGEYEPNVRAAWLLGTGTRLLAFESSQVADVSECVHYTKTRLQLVRAINGAHDAFFGSPLNVPLRPAINRTNVQDVTGIGASPRSHARAMQNRAGTGYYVVFDDEVCDGDADHGLRTCTVCTEYALETGQCPKESFLWEDVFPLQGSPVCLNRPNVSCPIDGPFAVTLHDSAGNALYTVAPDPFFTSTEAPWGLRHNLSWLFRQLTPCGSPDMGCRARVP